MKRLFRCTLGLFCSLRTLHSVQSVYVNSAKLQLQTPHVNIRTAAPSYSEHFKDLRSIHLGFKRQWPVYGYTTIDIHTLHDVLWAKNRVSTASFCQSEPSVTQLRLALYEKVEILAGAIRLFVCCIGVHARADSAQNDRIVCLSCTPFMRAHLDYRGLEGVNILLLDVYNRAGILRNGVSSTLAALGKDGENEIGTVGSHVH
jgi:hypothetical protein